MLFWAKILRIILLPKYRTSSVTKLAMMARLKAALLAVCFTTFIQNSASNQTEDKLLPILTVGQKSFHEAFWWVSTLIKM